MSASSIYWHYSGKEELVAAALEHAYRSQAQRLPNWLDTPPSSSRANDLYSHLMHSPNGEGEMGYWRVGLQLALTKPEEPVPARDRFLQIRGEAIEWTADWWERTLPENMPQRRAAARLMGNFTVAERESSFLKLRGPRTTDTARLTRIIAAALDAVAEQLVVLAEVHDLAPSTPTPPQMAVLASADDAESGREALLRGAQEAIEQWGYDGVSISKVCERAGLPASSLYWSFKDKDELLSAVISNTCAGWKQLREKDFGLPPGEHWAEQMRTFILPSLRDAEHGQGAVPMSLLLLLQRAEHIQTGRSELEEVLQETFEATVDWFSALLGSVAGPQRRHAQDVAVCLFRMLDGMLIGRRVDEQFYDPQLLATLISNAIVQIAQRDAQAA
ncbi:MULTISPECIES: TetR/AcrR family transcriptional regulator [Micrococcaceae]|uniref:TetR/AcrR family transcriptional regulator n=1 Tax=Micrococcaceae TaxID=1268 RepID=UPI001E2ED759|nr:MULTISPECIES: TetR/AcrR family transcriptional regulator [Micrococcaceae]